MDKIITKYIEKINKNEYCVDFFILEPELDSEKIKKELWNRIQKIENLKILTLNDFYYFIQPKKLSLPDLEELRLKFVKNCLIQDKLSIPKIFINLPKIKILNIEDDTLEHIKVKISEIAKFQNLKKLYIKSCKIEDFEHFNRNFKKLKTLEISNITFNKLPVQIYNLPNLEELNIDFENNLEINSKSYISKEDLISISDYFKIEYSKDIIKINLKKFGLVIKFTDFELYIIYTKKIAANKYEFKIAYNKKSQKIDFIEQEISNLFLYRDNRILFNKAKIAENNNIFFNKNASYLSKISITEYKKLKNFNISDFSKQVNIIIGINSSGKTTLLQAISLLFNSEDDRHYITIKERQFVEIKLYTEKKELKFKKELHLKQPEYNLEIPNSFLCLSYCENLFEGEEIEYRHTIEDFILGFAEPINTFSIFKVFDDKIFDPLKFLDLLLERELPSKFKTKFAQIQNLRLLLIKQINEFIKIVFSAHYEIVKEGYQHQVKELNTKKIFSLNEISEGYRANIMLIANIFIEIILSRYSFIFSSLDNLFKEVKGVILIDEFDRHLHPSALRKFLKGLKEFFPEIQFFLTTHNPIALQSAAGHKVFILKDGKAEPVDIKFGYSIETINNLFFEGNDKNYDIYAEDDITNLKKLKFEILDGKKKFSDFENFITDILSKNISEEFSSYLNFEKQYLSKQLKSQINEKN